MKFFCSFKKLQLREVFVLLSVLSLVACGGGGSTPPNPVPTNSASVTSSSAPTFIASSAANVSSTAVNSSTDSGTTTTSKSSSSAAVSSVSSSSFFSASSSSSLNPPHLVGGSIQGNQLNTASTFTTLAGGQVGADGIGGAARFDKPSMSATDGTNVYVLDSGNNTIRKIVIATGQVTTLAGRVGLSNSRDGVGSDATFAILRGIAIANGNLYVSDNNAIRKVVIATGAVTTIAGDAFSEGSTDGVAAEARFNQPYGLATDGINLYVADYRNNTIRKIVIATSVVTTLVGTAGTTGSNDDTGAAATFYHPHSITRVGASLYVVEGTNAFIRKIDISTRVVSKVALVNKLGVVATLSDPFGITSDATNLYVTETASHSIRKIVISTGVITTFAGHSGSMYSADGIGEYATFELPLSLSSDNANLYVTDSDLIRKIVIADATVTTLAGPLPGSDGSAAAASFNHPEGITTDGTNLYVADSSNLTIRKVVIATGEVSTIAGLTSDRGVEDGPKESARFYSPRYITTDGKNIYITDGTNKIRQIDIATGTVSTLAGDFYSGNKDGSSTTARFLAPTGVTTDGTNVYVADYGNNTIRKIIISTGEVSTFAGTGTLGSTDGIGLAASFNSPLGITTDGVNLFISDASKKVRKIEIATREVTTLANVALLSGAVDINTGAAVSLSYPHDLTTDGTNLYVSDGGDDIVLKIVIATGAVTTLSVSRGDPGMVDIGADTAFSLPGGITTDGVNLFVTDRRYNRILKIH